MRAEPLILEPVMGEPVRVELSWRHSDGTVLRHDEHQPASRYEAWRAAGWELVQFPRTIRSKYAIS